MSWKLIVIVFLSGVIATAAATLAIIQYLFKDVFR